jgi:Domain of unknown function (DUF4304)
VREGLVQGEARRRGKLLVVDSRDVTRDIRRLVWPALREAGFDSFTGRTAWRYVDPAVDVVNFQSFSASVADAVGCTPFSFSLNLGVWVAGDTEARALKPDKKGRPRPAEWECTKRTRLAKSVQQPWFEPFTDESSSRWPRALRIHREGLKRVMRSDRHDREDTWYVFSDGSNVVEMIADALRAIRETGLPWLEMSRADAVRNYEQRVRDGLV